MTVPPDRHDPSRGAPAPGAESPDAVEVSFVIPCLNEAETIERCVLAARRCIEQHGLSAEIIVADNRSTDGSPDIARRAGAHVVNVPIRGVGAAIMAGVEAAHGRYIIMGDADLQHDFAACFPFVERLRRGDCDLVIGSRLRGTIAPGAMRPLNRYLGNPILSWIGRLLFRAPVSDFHCGLRAFRREPFLALNLRTVGFEFTTEHIAKSALRGLRIAEIPITVYPDGRSRPPHLRPFNDGWRTLRFMLLLSPRWTLIIPGLLLCGLGAIIAALVAFRPFMITERFGFDVHSLVLGCMLVLVGYAAVLVGAAARIYAIQQQIDPSPSYSERLVSFFTLERGVAAGALMLTVGAILIGALAWRALSDPLRPEEIRTTMRPMIIGATLVALGVQTVLMSFFYSMLGITHRDRPVIPPGAPGKRR